MLDKLDPNATWKTPTKFRELPEASTGEVLDMFVTVRYAARSDAYLALSVAVLTLLAVAACAVGFVNVVTVVLAGTGFAFSLLLIPLFGMRLVRSHAWRTLAVLASLGTAAAGVLVVSLR
jgi:hypothetical protein